MPELKAIPIGKEDFKDIIDSNCYYVDKTLMIKDIIENGAKVTLFTRPRRFGKTLNMSMLRRYFEKTEQDNSYLFDGLKISQSGEKYKSYMGRFPVISISLKSMKQPTWEEAYCEFRKIIANEFRRNMAYIDSDALNQTDNEKYQLIVNRDGKFSVYNTSLKELSDILFRITGTKAIVLIDEYDVPLENAYFNGFYDKMINLIRSVFESVLKTNDSLEFAVLTGCLRISRESIFTGLNNLLVDSVRSGKYSSYFGFTEDEVIQLTDYYGKSDKFSSIKEWYDGYKFGLTDIYNPWSVLNYINNTLSLPDAFPEPYWSNTSSNSIIYKLIRESNQEVRDMVEELLNGGSVTVPIYEDTVYSEIDVRSDQIWSFLLFTGYLKQISTELRGSILYSTMVIPNIEVQSIYKRIIMQWFKEQVVDNSREELLNALLEQNTAKIEDTICDWLDETISYHDEKEMYYHGFMAGLLSGFKGYSLKSNRESGSGRYDLVLMERRRRTTAIIIEIKTSDQFKRLEYWCDYALNQIEENHCEAELLREGYSKIIRYGIAFYKKSCMVKKAEK